MATPVWVSSDGDWGQNASWSTGAPPADGDTVIFDGTSNVSVSASLTQNTIDVAYIIVYPEYTGDIGSSGTPLNIAGDMIIHRGPGSFYITETHATATLHKFIMNNRRGYLEVQVGCNYVDVLAGSVTLTSGCTGVSRAGVWGNAATLTTQGTGTIAEFAMTAGTYSGTMSFTDGYTQSGGTATATEASGFTSTFSGTLTGGTLVYAPTGTARTVGSLVVAGGTFDLRQNDIGAGLANFVVGPNGHVIYGRTGTVGSTRNVDLRDPIPDNTEL